MSLLHEYLPESPEGGSRFGSHFFDCWWECPTKWFNRFIRPHPVYGGSGLRPTKTASPLLIGSGFHDGLEAYYHSGWKDGRYDMEAGLTAARESFLARKDEFATEDAYDRDWEVVSRLLQSYRDQYGPGGLDCEYPEYQIMADANGEPLIEREFSLEIADGIFFTCRADLIVERDGYVNVLEHKTTSASFLGRLMESMRTATQATAECYIINKSFPELKVQGMICNAIVKNRGKKSEESAFRRQPFTRTPFDLGKFEVDIQRAVSEMEESLAIYSQELTYENDLDAAARAAFTMHRRNCVGFRPCEYLPACRSAGRESTMFRSGFSPRIVRDTPIEEEEND